jgi:rhodanese-related sulfurtransferase
MTGLQHGDEIQLRGTQGKSGLILSNAVCLCYLPLVACLAFVSITTASAADTSLRGTAAAEPRAKVLINKADTSCEAPDASKKKALSPNSACLVPFSAIDKLAGQKDFSLVDVRSPAEYDRYHITGSINIPLHQVKTKEFLKKLSVVMVNDGRSTSELERTCGELKQAGFNRVSVLEGGMFAWRANKRTLEGDPLAQVKLNRMSPSELIDEHNRPNLYVIDVSTAGKYKDIYDWLPAKNISVPFKPKGGSITRIATIISQQHKKSPKSIPLLIADNNDAYDRMDEDLRKSGVASVVLLLDGGIQGYREHLKKQSAIWSEQNKVRSYNVCKG